MSKLLTLDEALAVRRNMTVGQKRLILTNGCFDLLHLGHARFLQAARELGDCLIVGLNSDRSVRLCKGLPRPLRPEVERAELLAALSAVDFVVIFDEPTAEGLVATLQPDIYAKGGDYSPEELPEAQAVAAYGGRVRILPFVPGHSTTHLIQRILAAYGRSREQG